MATLSVLGYAAHDSTGYLSEFTFERRSVGSSDVAFKVTHCGICHSDLHQVRNEWKSSKYPMVPGHEIVGIVTAVGSDVTRFKVGDKVGVGCMVNSCGACDACHKKSEQFCPRCVFTYNSVDVDGRPTYGGFSDLMVVDERFVLRMPDSLPLNAAAPLLCAGITVYGPMKYYGMTEAGKKLGVVGLGGLGHVAVKLGKAFGLEVTVISTSHKKEKEAKDLLGADHFLVSTEREAMLKAMNSIDYIIDTVSVHHELDPLLALLKVNGKLVLIGLPERPLELKPGALIFGRKFVGGSLIGGVEETQEMMDFCANHGVTSIIEEIPMDYVNTAMDRLAKSDVKYRFVINVAESLKKIDRVAPNQKVC